MPLFPGSLAPYFITAGIHNPTYGFHTVGGRPLLMVFLGESDVESNQIINTVRSFRHRFDDKFASVFFFTQGKDDVSRLALADDYPGIRCLFDPTRKIAGLYELTTPAGALTLPALVLLDSHQRVIFTVVNDQVINGLESAISVIASWHHWRSQQRSLGHAPILVVDRIFDRPLCEALIEYYKANGGSRSGFMRDAAGITTGFYDDAKKRRNDCDIKDDQLRKAAQYMLRHRLNPLIKQAFNFNATRIERDIIACYDGAERGFFAAHRDNTTKATAHRKFAVTINLNAEQYEGGDLRFPEFGSATYRAPTGGAVVFSGALLHEALPVTSGIRYAYLPFLYGDADAAIRREGEKFLDKRNRGQADIGEDESN